jgi:hypothetical protein
VLTHTFAQPLSEMWKQRNRGGEGYLIAAQAVMRAEHDGYTLLVRKRRARRKHWLH